MNDISVKIEPPKNLVVEDVVPAIPESSTENEVDPLAIAEADVRDATIEEANEKKLEPEEGERNCDENAKDENFCNDQNLEIHGQTAIFKPEKVPELDKIDAPITSINTKENQEATEKLESSSNDATSQLEKVVEQISTSEPVELEQSNVEASRKESLKDVPIGPETKESTPVKSISEVEENKTQEKDSDVDMAEVLRVDDKKDQKVDCKPVMQPMNGDVVKEEQATKRRSSEDVDTESPLKRLCQEVEKTFPQHDSMVNDYIQTATKNNIDEIQRHTEQLLSEIQTLRELAQKKEHEWNNILHLKKVKEEILLRLLRKKQVISFEKAPDVNGSERTDPFDYLNQAKNLAIDKSDEISGLSIKQPGSTLNPMMQAPLMPVTSHFNPMAGLPPPYDKAAHLQSMPKPVFPQPLMMAGPTLPGFPRDMNGQLPTSFGLPMGRQGPTKDVKSIIADYRQRNPDITPRRGRRMKSILNPNMMNIPRPIAPKVDPMNSMNNLNNLNMLFNNLDMNQKAMIERLQQMQPGSLPNGLSFKDVLVQFANLQNNPPMMPNRPMEAMPSRPEHHIRPENRRRPERIHEDLHISMKQTERLASPSPRLPPPPPYPEISLLPVSTSQENSQLPQQNSLLHGILTKNCGEITITPVQPTPPPAEPQPEKTEEVVQLDDEESAASEGEASGSPVGSGSGRLVIDEGAAESSETPLCQGCRRRDAQFVCAGCANQWYCSRDCQVAAWDDHSEMCSG